MENGIKKSIVDVCAIIIGGTPDTRNKNYWNGKIPGILIDDFKNCNRFIYNTYKRITSEGLAPTFKFLAIC